MVDTNKIEKIVDSRRAAKIEYDSNGAHLLVMNNGHQWSGASIYSVEVANAAIDVLKEYVEIKKAGNHENTH